MWTQIATRFRPYDHHVVFEEMNEPRVAVNGVDDWVRKAEYYDVLNRLDAAALAAIRVIGGNNTHRLVMPPSYAAAPDDAQLAHYVQGATKYGMPTMWWDNGNKTLTPTSSDVMALLDRSNNTWIHQDINDAIFCGAQVK